MIPHIKRAFADDSPSIDGAQGYHDDIDAWLHDMVALLWRHSELGIAQDVEHMSLAELQGIYRYLSRLQRTSHTEAQAEEPNNIKEEK